MIMFTRLRLPVSASALLLVYACGDATGPEQVQQPCPGDLVRNTEGACVAPTVGPAECDPTGLRIDEVFANPEGEDTGFEFIELRGRTDQSLDGLRLVRLDAGGVSVADQALTGRADALGVFVIGGDQVDADEALDGNILNDAGAVQLVDCEGRIVDAVAWGSMADGTARPGEGDPAPTAPEGSSIGRCALGDDTDDNADDFGVGSPSPGQPNPGDNFADDTFCGENTTGCQPGALAGRLRIEELLYNPEGTDTGAEYIELRGEPNMGVDGVRLEGINGANGFTFFAPIVLAGSTDDNGLFVVGGPNVPETDFPLGNITLQNGPDNIVLTDCDGRSTLDALGYGSFDGDTTFAGEAAPAPAVSEGRALSRCGDGEDTGNNNADFGAAAPSPGALAAAETFDNPTFCGGGAACVLGALDVTINEVLYDVEGSETVDGEFIELRGTPGAALDGAILVAVNGNNGEPYGSPIPLRGNFDENGLYVVGGANITAADQPLTFTLQGGPDSLVVYDCDGETALDALAYGAFDEEEISAGEGTSAPEAKDGATLARCADADDTNNNVADFGVAAATPGLPNADFQDALFCDTTVTECVLGAVGAVRINEALTNPSGPDADAEFIELRGTPGQSLSGIWISGVNGSNGTAFVGPIRLNGTFDDNGYFVLGGTLVPERDQDLIGSLQNGPESLVLYDCDGTTVLDAMGYGNFGDDDVFAGEGDAAPTSEGASTARCEDRDDSDDNAADFSTATPTPGAANAGFENALFCVDVGPCTPIAPGAVLINELLANPDGPDAGAEFLELLAAPDADLTGLVIQGINGATGTEYFSVTLLGTANADGFYVLGGPLVGTFDALLPSIQNGPDSIVLRDCGDTVVDALAYGDFGEDNIAAGEGAPAASPANTSLGRRAGADTDDNAADFVEQTTPSPGAVNE